MQSINIYDLINEPDNPPHNLTSGEYKVEEMINGLDETLTTKILRNELKYNDYVSFDILTDKVYKQKIRIGSNFFQYYTIQEIYRAYYKELTSFPTFGALITFCKNEEAERIKNILADKFNMNLEQHTFDIMKIIEEATDVRDAKFTVKIETVDSIRVSGTRVSDTKYYEKLFAQGNLNAVIVTFDMPSKAVTFRISKEGKIFLYSPLNDNEMLDFVVQLLEI